MRYSVSLTTVLHDDACKHLMRKDRQEDLCFATWYPSQGNKRLTALLHKIILPKVNERSVHGNASFMPNYIQRAIGQAVEQNAGLALLHSHLGPGWQGMSDDDVAAEANNAAAVKGATGLPFVGLTLGTDGAWSSRIWEKIGKRQYERRWCESTRVVGGQLKVTYNDRLVPPPKYNSSQVRTISAWGRPIQNDFSRLRIGIIGAGSVGCIIAESLARMGISSILLLDFDEVEEINLDRLLHATRRDIGCAKVSVLARAIRKSATASSFSVAPLEYSIIEEEGFREALDCDVLFSCVDRPSARSMLNFIAYSHMIPVIDGGIAVVSRQGRALRRAEIRAHVAAPMRPCLECLGQFNSGLVTADKEGYFDDPQYIKGLPEDHPIRSRENVFGFSAMAASLEVMQMLSMVVAPSGISNPTPQIYHFVTGTLDRQEDALCHPNCIYSQLQGRGDRVGVTMTDKHEIAEKARRGRKRWRARLNRFMHKIGLMRK